VDLLSLSWTHELMGAYGLWLLFGIVMLESMGIPMPGETALVATALYAGSTHTLSVGSVIAVAAMAAIIGDNLGYLAGRRIGLPLILRYGHYVRLNKPRLRVGQYLFLRHGGKIVFFGRFIALLRTYAALLAGVNLMDWRHFLVVNATGGICWATIFGMGAYLLGKQFEDIASIAAIPLIIAAIICVIAGMIFFRHHEKELERRAEAALCQLPID
jgi:membrane protein DedA with SNARE-associated domain